MRKFALLNIFIFIFIFGACNCGSSQKNTVMDDTYDFSTNIIHHNMQYDTNDVKVDEEDKRIIEKALCRIEIVLFYKSLKFKDKTLLMGIEGSGFFPFETEDKLFFLTAGHITVGLSEIPKVILAPTKDDPKETIYILDKLEYRIWNTHNEKDVVTFSSKEVKVVAEEFFNGIDFGILSFEKRDGLNLRATPVRWGTTKNLESGDMLYLFAEPSYMGKFLTKGYVINPGSLNSDVASKFSIKPENIFYMSNDLTHGSSGGPVFAIGKEDGKLYLIGIAVMYNIHPGMVFKIATKIDHVIEALQKYE